MEVFICTAVQIILWLFAQPVTGTLPRSIHALISSSIICLHFTAYCIVRCWRRCHAHWGGRGWDQHQLPRGSMTSCPTLPCTLRRSRVRPKPTPSRSTMSFCPGPRIVPSCHPGWGAVSDLGGSFAERGFKMGHRYSGTTTRAKTAPFQLSFHTLIFRCFVLIPSLCLLSASFFPLC